MWTIKRNGARCVLLGLLIVALVVLVTACGGSSDTTTTTTEATTTTAPPTTAPPTTAGGAPTTAGAPTTSVVFSGEEAQIAENFIKFFDGKQPVADKIGLLEDGEQYKADLEKQAASPLGQMASVTVASVKIISPTSAEVGYTIMVGDMPALPDQTGEAVKQDGAWKVAAKTFLALLALQGAAGQ